MWKLYPARKVSKKKRRKLFLYWFIALVLIVAFLSNLGKIVTSQILNFVAKPQGEKLTFTKFEGEKIVGVILSDPLILATFDPKIGQVDVFELPKNLYLEVQDTGFYLASRIRNLKPGTSDAAILVDVVRANFLVPIDFYLDFSNYEISESKILEIKDKISKPTSLLWFFQIPTKSPAVLKTNFTLLDQFSLLWQLRNVRADKFNYRKMAPSNFEELVLPDGERVLKVAQDGIEPETAKTFQDLKIASEGLTVEVKNATQEEGLAQKIVSICGKIGIAAAVSESPDKGESETKILVKPNFTNSLTAKRLKKTFGGAIEDSPNSQFADIVILAGADLAAKF